MIEIQIDQREIERQLARIGNMPVRLAECVRLAMKDTAPAVRQRVIDTLKSRTYIFEQTIEKSVGRVLYNDGGARFRISSGGNLPLEEYSSIDPLEQTARKGMSSRNWPGFSYRFSTSGKEYNSLGTLTGKDGKGSIPFLVPVSSGGNQLQVKYRHSNKLFRLFGPSVQYHAMMPEVLAAARELGQQLFSAHLDRIVGEAMEGSA